VALRARHRIPASFHIGVGRDEEGNFLAHAWTESGGEVLIGDGDLSRYRTLLEVEPDDFRRVPRGRLAA
jgi:hypothetical protein